MGSEASKEWVDRARVDLDSAEILSAHGGHADTICFLCQQAVEKLLKALLAGRGDVPPKVHSLVFLARRVGADAAWSSPSSEDLAFLSGCFLSSRYPTLDPERRTPEDASRTLRIAREALAHVAGVEGDDSISASRGRSSQPPNEQA